MLVKTIIKHAAPVPSLESFNSFLFVGPHPDDIEIGAGATAAKLAAAGKRVCFLICIDGRFGDSLSTFKGDELAEERKREALASAAFLGIHDVRFLGFKDGACYECSELEKAIAAVISDFSPDVILCPDPDVISECHQDHLNVGRICKELANFAPYENIFQTRFGLKAAPVKALAFYMTAKPNSFVSTRGLLERQLDSVFKYHLSQFPAGCDDAKSITLYLRLRAYSFGLKRLCKTAEGFRILGRTHMHCLPEAGE